MSSLNAFKSYVSLEKNYSRHTVNAYQKDIEEFITFCIDEFDLNDINKIEYNCIRNWIVFLVNKKISNRSINRKVASLKAYYKFLYSIGDIGQNPLAKHKALKVSKKIEVPFSESEMEEVLHQFNFTDDFEGQRDKLIIELLYATGIRRAELVDLKLSDIDLNSSTIRVLGKRNKERIVPILKTIEEQYLKYLGFRNNLDVILDERYVFLSKSGSKIYDTLVYRVINKYLSKVSSKLKKSPHILRHTFATHLLNKGADLNSVKELLGHSSLASTQVYTHNSIAELKKIHLATHPRNKK